MTIRYINGLKYNSLYKLSHKFSHDQYTCRLWAHLHYARKDNYFGLRPHKNDNFILGSLIEVAESFNNNTEFIEKVSLAQLKVVFLRGVLAYLDTQPEEQKTYIFQYGMARVFLFLKMLSGGNVNNAYRKEDGHLMYGLNNVGPILYFSNLKPKYIEDFSDDKVFLELEDNHFYMERGGINSELTSIHSYFNDLSENMFCDIEFDPFDIPKEVSSKGLSCKQTRSVIQKLKKGTLSKDYFEFL